MKGSVKQVHSESREWQRQLADCGEEDSREKEAAGRMEHIAMKWRRRQRQLLQLEYL